MCMASMFFKVQPTLERHFPSSEHKDNTDITRRANISIHKYQEILVLLLILSRVAMDLRGASVGDCSSIWNKFFFLY